MSEQDTRTARQKSDDALIRAADKVRELGAALNEAHAIHTLEAGIMSRRFDEDQKRIADLLAEADRLASETVDAWKSCEKMGNRIAELEAAIVEIRQYIPACNCDQYYTRRNLIMPDCHYHKSGFEEVDEITLRVTGS